jgi:beta-lactamase class A
MQSASNEPVIRELTRIAKVAEPAVVGLAAQDISSGRSLSLNADEWFPMASTYKLPIAIVALDRVAKGELSLAEMVPVRPVDLRPGSDLALALQHPGASFSVANVIDLSIAASDNAAADRVLALAGGPQNVTKHIRRLGIQNMNVDRSTLQVLLAFVGAEAMLEDERFSFRRYNELTNVSREKHTAATLRAADDPRDATTPSAMTELLRRLAQGQLLPRDQTEFLMTSMIRARGSSRIRGLLPPGIPRAAHKSGTLIEGHILFVNDVGIIRLADGRRIALSVFIKKATASLETCEQIIAHLARAVYDYYASAGPTDSANKM